MRLESKYLDDVRQEKIISTNYFLNKLINDKKEIVATILNKKGNYWVYHKNTLEELNLEKGNPGEKLWYIVKYISNDREHGLDKGL